MGHTPGPWRWGFWKYDGQTRTYTFVAADAECVLGDEANWLYGGVEYGTETFPDQEPSELAVQIIVVDQEGGCESDPYGGHDVVRVSEEDRVLIAAAPELLAAYRWTLKELERVSEGDIDPVFFRVLTYGIWERLTATIAKAEGR